MREILFKAKRKDNNKWVDGCLWTMLDNSDGPITKKYFIRDKNYSVYGSYSWKDYEVIPETVSQFTGLKDKKGVKIFENDIVKYDSGLGGYETSIIYYDEQTLSLNMKTNFGYFYDGLCNLKNKKNIEVIGNVFDEEVEEKK